MVAGSKKADKPAVYKKNVSLTKKWMSKMRKKGKVRRSDMSKFNKYSKLKDDVVDEKTSKLTDDLEALRSQDAEFYDKLAENFGFEDESSSSDDDDLVPPSKKSKTIPKIKEEPKSDDEQTDAHPLLEVRYARSNFVTADESNDDKSHLLPIKNAAGKILQVVREVETKDEEEEKGGDSEIEQDEPVEEKTSDNEPISTSKLFADRAQLLEHYKRDIAAKASAIIANPQQNMSKLKSVVQLACGVEVDSLVQITVQKLAAASSLEIFMDILPSYSIRKWSEAEEKQQMKKETKLLHEYEQALLRHYQKFLKQLDNFCKCNMKKKLNRVKLTPKLVESCQTLGVKCVTRLLAEQFHFNFRLDLLDTIVPLMSFKNETIRNMCCESVETVFKTDKLGEASFDIVKSICKFVKDNPTKSHPRMLETFLQLKIKEVEKIDQMAKTKRDILAKKRKIKMMSRKERKTFKRLKKLDDDLAELEAEEKKENVLKFHTKIMSQIFAVYFRVLKREKLGSQPLNKCKILPVVLLGLSKFAHFINIEFFDDLLNSLLNLVLKADLNVTESLNCVKTAFVILSGEGQALNIDPYGFYRFVYNVLPKIADEKRIELRKQQLCTALQCLEFMLNKRRKQVTIGRVAAFVKRLVILAPKFSGQEAIAIMHGIRTYFIAHSKIECLIDDENQGIGSGFYMPALDDPDRCNAQATSIIEDLKRIQQTFDHKAVRRLCNHILNGLPSNGVHSLHVSSTEKSPWVHLCLEG